MENFQLVIAIQPREAVDIVIISQWIRSIIVPFSRLRETCTRHAKPNHFDSATQKKIGNSMLNLDIKDIVRRKQANINGNTLQAEIGKSTANPGSASKDFQAKSVREVTK